ncbi:MAG: ATP-binding cassette domain-containing protein [Candidatus Latescibacterota bacterium]|nr:ATP-binding cassette domain-containing protein [Candidatus Latescibacterota bacterium]
MGRYGIAAMCRGPGQTVGVVSESGSGKTTLGQALLRLVASGGPIEFEGRDIQGWQQQIRPLQRQMQIVFQDPFVSLSPRLSAFQIIEEGLDPLDRRRSRATTAIDRRNHGRSRPGPDVDGPIHARVFRRPTPAPSIKPCRPRSSNCYCE